MSKTFQALSASEVRSLLKKPGRYCDGEGLWLFVSSERSASWIFRYGRTVVEMKSGQSVKRQKQYDVGLGSALSGNVSLADAREKARSYRKILADGGDPKSAKEEFARNARLVAARSVTFKEAADNYISQHECGWATPKHRQQWRNTLATYAHPLIGHRPVQAINTADVLTVLRPIWTAKPETARRLRARIQMILDAEAVHGHRDRAAPNPAVWGGHLQHVFAKPGKKQERKVRHHPSMAFAEVPFFMATLRQQVGIGAKALQFTILTAARTGEVIGARWSEIDLERALWSVPAPRMKAGREHIVPLAPSAVALLRSLPVKEGIVFRADTFKPALSNAAMSAVLARMGHSAVSVHGFRASFRTWARDKRPDDREAAEVSLAHAVGDKTEQSYSRGDLMERRRPLMDAWAEFCLSNQTGLRLVG